MKAKQLLWIVPLVLIIGYSTGYAAGVFNQDIQPEIADRLEQMSANILPDMLIQLRTELNETQYCEALQELECELRQDEDFVKPSMDDEFAPKVLIK